MATDDCSSVKVAGDRKNINEVLFGWNRLSGIKKGSQRWGREITMDLNSHILCKMKDLLQSQPHSLDTGPGPSVVFQLATFSGEL